jgi:hypothetical protein
VIFLLAMIVLLFGRSAYLAWFNPDEYVEQNWRAYYRRHHRRWHSSENEVYDDSMIYSTFTLSMDRIFYVVLCVLLLVGFVIAIWAPSWLVSPPQPTSPSMPPYLSPP